MASPCILNGAKCRRKDITDIFLGTGLGPRSYAIIEQGMISRLIEAKPRSCVFMWKKPQAFQIQRTPPPKPKPHCLHPRNLERLEDIAKSWSVSLAWTAPGSGGGKIHHKAQEREKSPAASAEMVKPDADYQERAGHCPL